MTELVLEMQEGEEPARKVTFAGAIPFCCPSKHAFDLWKAASVGDECATSSFCEDCTPEYQRQMIREKACENPLIRFFWEPPYVKVDPKTGARRAAGGYIYGAFEPDHHVVNGTKLVHEEIFTSEGFTEAA